MPQTQMGPVVFDFMIHLEQNDIKWIVSDLGGGGIWRVVQSPVQLTDKCFC